MTRPRKTLEAHETLKAYCFNDQFQLDIFGCKKFKKSNKKILIILRFFNENGFILRKTWLRGIYKTYIFNYYEIRFDIFGCVEFLKIWEILENDC